MPEDRFSSPDVFDQAEFEETRPVVVGAIDGDPPLVIENAGWVSGPQRSGSERKNEGKQGEAKFRASYRISNGGDAFRGFQNIKFR
jgi:hypothetical protein